jgi:multicomponent Na+:H+ antiporter subunit F
MVDTILNIALFLMLASILLTLVRFIKGPSIVDRVISFDVLSIVSIVLIAMIAHWSFRVIYLDVAMIYGLLSFLGVIIVGRYLERGL